MGGQGPYPESGFVILPYIAIVVTVLLESINLLLKITLKITFTCFIKSVTVLLFTNPSKRSTFNIGQVPDKNFRMIILTVFPVGVITNR